MYGPGQGREPHYSINPIPEGTLWISSANGNGEGTPLFVQDPLAPSAGTSVDVVRKLQKEIERLKYENDKLRYEVAEAHGEHKNVYTLNQLGFDSDGLLKTQNATIQYLTDQNVKLKDEIIRLNKQIELLYK